MTDSRPAYMTPEAFAASGERIFGQGWQTHLARALGRSRITMNRYAQGTEPVPLAIALLLTLAVARLEAGEALPDLAPVGFVRDDRFYPNR